jgi:hypothetical protein
MFLVGSFSTVIAVCDVRVGVSACWIVSLLISDSDFHICTGVRWCGCVFVCVWGMCASTGCENLFQISLGASQSFRAQVLSLSLFVMSVRALSGARVACW